MDSLAPDYSRQTGYGGSEEPSLTRSDTDAGLEPRPLAIAAGLLLAVTLLRCYAAARLGLGDAEAYYWTWSREPATGYLDHGPVVAWLVRLGTALGGQSTLAVRAPFILISTLTALGCGLLAARLAGARAALWAVLGLTALPAFLIAGPAANPDVPFAALVVALLAVLLVVERGARRATAWLALAGLIAGLAISTKLFGLLLLVPLLLACLRQRSRLLAATAAFGATLVAALPYLAWNLEHGLASLRYHLWLRHTQPAGPSLANLGKLIGGQLLYVSPLLLVGLIAAAVSLWRRRRSGPERVLLETALPLLGAGYLLILLVPSAEPHWPIAGYLPLLVWLAARLPAWWRERRTARGLTAAALVLALLLAAAVHLHLLTNLGVRLMPSSYVPRLDLSNELHGWPAVAEAVLRHRRSGELVAGCHYTVCSQLLFAGRGRFPVVCPSPRLDQFDLGPRGDGSGRRGVDLLYVLDERFPFEAARLYRCARVEPLGGVEVARAGRVVRRFSLERCAGFLGLRAPVWPP